VKTDSHPSTLLRVTLSAGRPSTRLGATLSASKGRKVTRLASVCIGPGRIVSGDRHVPPEESLNKLSEKGLIHSDTAILEDDSRRAAAFSLTRINLSAHVATGRQTNSVRQQLVVGVGQRAT